MALGRAEVDVVADTSRFSEEVRAAAERASGDGVDVGVQPDLTGFRDRIRNAARGMRTDVPVSPDTTGFRDALRARLAKLSAVPVRVSPNTAGFREALRTRLAKQSAVRVPVAPDTTGFREDLRGRLANQSAVRVPVAPSTTGFREDLRGRLANQSAVRVPVAPDTTGFRETLRTRLAAMSAFRVAVDLRPDLTGFRQAVRDATAGLRVSVKVVPDMTGFRIALQSRLAAMAALRVPVTANAAGLRNTVTNTLNRGGGVPLNIRPRLILPNDYGQTGALGNVLIAGLFGEVGHLFHALSFLDPALQRLGREFSILGQRAREVIGPMRALGTAITGFVRNILRAARALGAGALFRGLISGIRTASSAVRSGLSSMLSALRGFGSRAGGFFSGAFRGLADSLRTQLRAGLTVLGGFGRTLRAFAGGITASLRTAFGGGGLGRSFSLLGLQMVAGLRLAFASVRGVAGQIGNYLRIWARDLASSVGGAFRSIGSVLSSAFSSVRNVLGRFFSSVSGVANTVFGALRNAGQAAGEAFSGLFSALRNVGTTLLNFGRQLHAVAGAIFGVAGALFQAASPFIQFIGLLVGGVGALGALYQPIGGIIQAVDGLGSGLVALPAAASIGAAGLATLIFALGGVSQAFSAALQQNDKFFDLSIQSLGPLQQKFAKTMRDAFKPAQLIASTAFINPVMKAFDALKGTGAGGALSQGLKDAAGAMGNLASAALRFLGTASGITLIKDSFGGLRAIVQGIADGLPTLLKGFSDAVDALLGGGQGGLQSTVQGLTERLGNFLSRLAIQGSIQRGWDRFVNTLKDLWSIAKSLVGTLHGVSQALVEASSGASGGGRGKEGASGGPLGSLVEVFKKIDDWVNGGSQDKLVGFFSKLDEVGRAVWTTFKQLGSAFGTFASSLLGGSGDGASKATKGQSDGIDSFTKSIQQFGQVFADHKKDIADFGKEVSKFFDLITKDGTLGSFIENLGTSLELTMEAVNLLTDSFKKLKDGVEHWWSTKTFDGAGDSPQQFFQDLGKVVEKVGDIFDALGDTWDALHGDHDWGWLGDIADWIGDKWNALWDLLFGHSIIPDMINAFDIWFGKLPGIIEGHISSIPGIIGDVFGGLWGIVSGRLASFASSVLGFFTSLGSRIATSLSAAVSGAISSAKSAASDAAGSIASKLNPLNWFANGGVVRGPQVVGVGEAGPEVILPLTRPRRLAELLVSSGALDIAARSGLLAGAASGGRVAPRDVSVHIHTAATSQDIVIRRMQRAMAHALTA